MLDLYMFCHSCASLHLSRCTMCSRLLNSVQGVISVIHIATCLARPPLWLHAPRHLSLTFLGDKECSTSRGTGDFCKYITLLLLQFSSFHLSLCVSASCPVGPEQWSLKFSISQRRRGTITHTLSQVMYVYISLWLYLYTQP